MLLILNLITSFFIIATINYKTSHGLNIILKIITKGINNLIIYLIIVGDAKLHQKDKHPQEARIDFIKKKPWNRSEK